jgi:hypothetical protein
MGTRALWQHTNATTGHGQPSGDGSARRVREFRIGSDMFGNLRRGEAVIYTPVAGEPTRASILPVELPSAEPSRIDPEGGQHRCEIAIHPEDILPDFKSTDDDPAPAPPSTPAVKPVDDTSPPETL